MDRARGCARGLRRARRARSAPTGPTGGRSASWLRAAGARRRSTGGRRARRSPARSPPPPSPTTSPAGASGSGARLLPARPTFNVVAEAGDRRRRADGRLGRPPRRGALRRCCSHPDPGGFGTTLPGAAGAHRHDAAADVAGRRRPAARRRRRAHWARAALRRAGTVLALGCGGDDGGDRRAPRRARRQRQPDAASPSLLGLARWLARASRSPACACCWSRPAARSRSWRGCRPSRARHFAALPTDRTHVRLRRHRRLARARHARGRGHAARCTTTRRTFSELVARVRARAPACTCAAACASATRPMG